MKAATQKQIERLAAEKAERFAEDLRRMADVGAWPCWPWLPMKRYTNGANECCVVHADDIGTACVRVYFINLFEIKTWFPEPGWKSESYSSTGGVLNAGWIVD